MDEFSGDNVDIQALKNKRNGIPVDLTIDYIPNNPYTISADAPSFGVSKILEGEKYKTGFFEHIFEKAKEINTPYAAIHGLYERYANPSPQMDIPPPGWNPKSDPTKFVDINPQYLNYLYDATGPKDLDYRLERVKSEQHHDEVIANGGWTAGILGGLSGALLDPISYIPIIGQAKYARLAPAFYQTAFRALPGVATYSVLNSAARETDKVNGSLTDFMTNSVIDTVFGTALFGGLGVAGLSTDKMQLWNLRKLTKDYIDGIDYKINVNDKGEIIGLKAFDTTGNLSAARVSLAQDIADSEFAKTGLFKVPYLGTAMQKFISMPMLGTPLPRLLTSPFKTVSAFADRVMNHNIITKGLQEGKTSPIKFASLMNQEFAYLRVLDAQMKALRLERNGFKINNRTARGLTQIGIDFKANALELLGKDLAKSEHVSQEQFYQEVENVLVHEVPSDHPSVNEAAKILRDKIDSVYKNFRIAYNLPEDWLPPKTANGYLMRVYDTEFLNANESKWINVIANYLKESDALIEERLEPLTKLEEEIERQKNAHEALLRSNIKTDGSIKESQKLIDELKLRRKIEEEILQNELRENPEFQLHVEDWNALSAREAQELKALTKRIDIAAKEITEQKNFIRDMKERKTKAKSRAMKAKTVVTGEKHLRRSDIGELALDKEMEKLRILEKEHEEEVEKLQEQIQQGQINPRFYYQEKGSKRFILKNPNERLKFRPIYSSHNAREVHAKAYYDTIMNQTAEDTINQVMGKIKGNVSENPIKARTLLVPDKLLYDNNFMSKDLMAKVANYIIYLSRRTNIKKTFSDFTLDGGIEQVIGEVNNELEKFRAPINDQKIELENKLQNTHSEKEKKYIQKKLARLDKQLRKYARQFRTAKEDLTHIYEKMMGLKQMSRKAKMLQRAIMSITAMGNLGFVPITMINDISASGLQHGIWPFVRDGVYPIVNSIFGLLKSKDSEALRKTAPSVHLAMQDVLTGFADKNWSMFTEPYVNLGKIVNSLEHLAHFSSNFTLTNYIDNGLQRIAGSVAQGELIRILHAFKAGSMTEKEGLYLRKYGIDPHIWADRMIAAFKQDGGGKTAIGGYQSLFWKWQDLEAANQFSRAVFDAIQSTTIQRGLLDSPFWADNVIGSLVHGFSGWTYASLNRYVIPSMQYADAQKLLGVLFMLTTGYFVSPFRRLARGEEPFPENQTDKQRLYETIQDSGYFSWFMNILADANIASGGTILSDFKNDRYKDRTRVGLLGPAFGTANRMADIVSAAASNEMNEADVKKMFRMIPPFNASWTQVMSNKIVEGLELPKTRAQAKAQKNFK